MLFFDRKEIYKFKADNKNVNFPTQFCLGSISNKFDPNEYREVSLEGNLYGFFSRLQCYWCSSLFNKYFLYYLASADL